MYERVGPATAAAAEMLAELTSGSAELSGVAGRLAAAASDLAGYAAGLRSVGRLDEWVDLVAVTQRLVNTLFAVQQVALAGAARTICYVDDDGVLSSAASPDVRFDAGGLVSGLLAVADTTAQGRIEQAIRTTGLLPEVHTLALRGAATPGQTAAVCRELADVPDPETRALSAPVAAWLAAHPEAGAGRVRVRVRALVARHAPESLQAAAERAHTERSLTRWTDQPGTDTWLVQLPVEVAAPAWEAIDAIAQRIRRDGGADTIRQARADALAGLIDGHSQGRYVVHLLTTSSEPAAPAAGQQASPGAALAAAGIPAAVGSPASGAAVVAFAGHSDPVLVRRQWLAARLVAPGTRVDPTPLLPAGALDPAPVDSRDGYRPNARLVAWVKARDGRCRFPGCTINARFTDLDHVRPYPQGGTEPGNLLCLCRRHHRVKQSAGWRVGLAPDGTATWRDPTGRVHRTEPVDHRLPRPGPPGPPATPAPPLGPHAWPGPLVRDYDRGIPSGPVDAHPLAARGIAVDHALAALGLPVHRGLHGEDPVARVPWSAVAALAPAPLHVVPPAPEPAEDPPPF